MPWVRDPSWLVLAAALAFDLLLGELPSRLHPVVWMGNTIGWLRDRAPREGPRRQLAMGAFMALAVPLAFAAGASLLELLRPWPWAWLPLSALALKSTFAVRALGRAAFGVRDALNQGSVPGARYALRSLCSRDPSALDPPLLVAATVESVAENASDSFVAPVLFYALFGLPGAVFYRAVNTLDAMIGYHGKYEYLGKASARLDDLLNLVPARLTAALLLAAGSVRRGDVRGGWAMLRRDAGKTESPNAGRPMATMAGLLRVQLEKVGYYRLGDASEPLVVSKIDDAWSIVAAGAALYACLMLALVGARGA
jgi:adenosylcobinamide-phosphate synthase